MAKHLYVHIFCLTIKLYSLAGERLYEYTYTVYCAGLLRVKTNHNTTTSHHMLFLRYSTEIQSVSCTVSGDAVFKYSSHEKVLVCI